VRIVACIKQVPDTTDVAIDPETGTLVRAGAGAMFNPLDAHAVEEAVRLKEEWGGNAIALSMGPPAAEQILREAIAGGCDRGILLTDPVLAGSDTWATSYALACAVRTIGDVDLVLCGKQAVDGDTAQVGPGLAAHLGWPQVAYVRAVLRKAENRMRVECLTDRGGETWDVRLPAVLTVLKDLNEPRLPSLVGQMRARRCRIEKWRADDISADVRKVGLVGSPTRVRRVFSPPRRPGGTMWRDKPAAAARKLAETLRQEGLL